MSRCASLRAHQGLDQGLQKGGSHATTRISSVIMPKMVMSAEMYAMY